MCGGAPSKRPRTAEKMPFINPPPPPPPGVPLPTLISRPPPPSGITPHLLEDDAHHRPKNSREDTADSPLRVEGAAKSESDLCPGNRGGKRGGWGGVGACGRTRDRLGVSNLG